MRVIRESWIWLPCMLAILTISTRAVYAQESSPTRSLPTKVGGVDVGDVLQRLGAKLERGSDSREIDQYSSHFDRMDPNRDGKHTKEEYVENGVYMTPQARAGIFRAADGNSDGVVTKAEYVLNRIITDEAKTIVQGMDDNKDGWVERAEFVQHAAKLFSDRDLADQVFAALDSNADGGISIPEYLRVWGQWARAGRKPAEERLAARRTELADSAGKPGRNPASITLTYDDIAARLYGLEQLATLPVPGERSGNFSSWDRGAKYNAETKQYEGWDANADGGGSIRPAGTGIVAAEIDGPGVIWRVWSALANEGHIKIFIDGHETPALDIPFAEFFNSNSKSGAFAYPELVLTLSRGRNNFVPIPFQKSCKIVLEKDWGAYYQITCTRFPAGTTVPSFRGEFNQEERAALQKANDVFAARGTDPKPPNADRQTVAETVTIEPGESVDICRVTGRRAITQIHVAPDADDDNPIRTLRELALSITWDDDPQPAVWTPLGDFFGTAPGINHFKSLPVGMTEDGFYAYWYMPFSKSARLTIANDGVKPRTLGVRVVHQPVATDKPRLRFHAKWHRDSYVGVDEKSFTHGDRWPDWPLLVTEGRGRFVGVNLHVWNPNPFGQVTKRLDVDAKQFSPRIFSTMLTAAQGWWWGEGDEKFFVDGEKMPSTFGTGSEDYFGYAWAADNPVEFASALQNQPLNKNNSLGHVSNNRFQLADNVPFQTRFEAVIEKYHPNNWPLLYACTAYWYQAAGQADLYQPVAVGQRVDYYVQPSREALVPVDGIYEGEQHLLFDPPARVQMMTTFGDGWSGGHQLLWYGDIGEEASFMFKVEQQYKGPMIARFTLAPDYGIFDVLLDGEVLKKGIDLYDSRVTLAPKQKLGTVELSPGMHQLTFRLTGGNKQARRFQDKLLLLGLDYMALAPAE